MEASIALKKVSKHFKNRYVLSNLNLGIETGSTFVILGRNGEGKSTFLKLLSGHLTPSQGKIYINGHIFSENRHMIKTIGFMGDNPGYNDSLTLSENLKQRADLLNMPDKLFIKRKNFLAEKFNIQKFLAEKTCICSSGIKKRLALSLSLLNDPDILIWDEPLAHLDFNLRKILLDYLLEIKGQKTVVIATNEFTELHTVADRWLVLHNKGIRFDGDLEKMTTQIDLPFTGEIETAEEQDISHLKIHPDVKAISEQGNSIIFQCNGFTAFTQIINSTDPENLLRISCNSIDLEELLNQLLSDEGLA